MIGRLTGMLVDKSPPQVLIETHGVGYEVDVPMSTFFVLPPLGERVILHTHVIVREDAHLLFGFATTTERAAFRELLKISGVGARIALAVLSGLSVDELAQAVTLQDAARLVRIPGIGKKTAERLLLELKGKLGAQLAAPGTTAGAERSDVTHALIALGYSEREALAAVKALPADTPVADGLRIALKSLARG